MSPSEAKVSVIAETGVPTAAVSIFDGNLNVVARGGGRIETDLAPGIYKFVGSTGQQEVSQIVEVTPREHPTMIELAGVRAAPVRVSLQPDPLDVIENLARRLSTQPGIAQGTGSECFVFAMDTPRNARPESTAPDHPCRGLKLLTFEGTVLADFSTASPEAGCAGLNIALNPGCYLLHLDRPEGDSLEQTIMTCHGWQTHVLLPLQVLSTGGTQRAPNLENATVLMSRTGQGVPWDREYIAWIELARQWLAQGEPFAPVARLEEAVKAANAMRAEGLGDEQLRNALSDKFTNPMLGIYAAHLMMLNPNPGAHDIELLKEVAKNLRFLLGDPPDVTAIDLWMDENAPATPLQHPPMLRDSWKIIVNRSRKRESLTPAGSYALRVSDRLWGAGAWLVWRTPPETAPGDGAASAARIGRFGITLPRFGERKPDPGKLVEAIRKKRGSQSIGEFLRAQEKDLNLTGPARIVLAYLAYVQQGQAAAATLVDKLEPSKLPFRVSSLIPRLRSELEKKTTESVQNLLSVDRMVNVLGLPRATVDEALTALARKSGL